MLAIMFNQQAVRQQISGGRADGVAAEREDDS
jgi:hypothetical protein